MNNIVACLIVYLIFCYSSLAQNYKKLSRSELNEDLNYLQSALYSSHPSIFRYTCKSQLDSNFNANEFSDSATTLELEKRIRSILCHVGCGHTSIYRSVVNPDQLILPFRFYYDGKNLWVRYGLIDSLSKFNGYKVFAINNHRIEELIGEMKNYHSSDGYNQTLFLRLINYEYFFNWLYNFYFDCDSVKTLNLLSQEGDSINLNAKTIAEPKNHNYDIDRKYKICRYHYLNIDTSTNTAFLKIESFSIHPGIARPKYKKVFKELKSLQTQNLVIDLRDNGGGLAFNANLLLSYLVNDYAYFIDKRNNRELFRYLTPFNKCIYPFTYLLHNSLYLRKNKIVRDSSIIVEHNVKDKKKYHFNDNVYVITNGMTFSSASYVASVLKYKCKAILVGQETGGGEAGCNGEYLPFIKLPSSKIKILIPQSHLNNNVVEDQGHGVIPDFETNYTVEDIIFGRDIDLDEVTNDIANH
jgi:hypothetical protein